MSTTELYNAKDKKEVRQLLLKEQNGLCALTGLPIDESKAVLDHCHNNHFVRGVLHRSVNSCLGVFENAWKRHMKWWYNGTLSDFLRECANYIEQPQDNRYIHDNWLKACQSKFNALDEKSKAAVLKDMALNDGKNGKERKEIFRKGLLSRRYTLTQIENILRKEVKDGK